MTPTDFFAKAVPLAVASGHLFPGYACCEAAEESNWGESELARLANNLFGQKQGHTTAGHAVIVLPTREYASSGWVTIAARFLKFQDWAESFAARMALLRALAPDFAGYAAALDAANGRDFVTEVSRNWSTDPRRAGNVLEIYDEHATLIEELLITSAKEVQ